jgi:Arc/MetJ-type ribon-helix-helix transcriptional regulator
MTQVAIQIPDDLKPFIDQSVKTGLYSDAADFVLTTLYDMKAVSEQSRLITNEGRLKRLRSAITAGLEDVAAGSIADFDAEDIITRGRARIAANAVAHG